MLDPVTVAGLVSTSIGLTKRLISAIDLMMGACTKNTPEAASWSSALSNLKIELIHAKDQLDRVKAEIEPMRVKQGPGYDAANLKRKELTFDDLLLELKEQLETNERQIRTATDEFNQKGINGWLWLEAFSTRAREAITPIKSHSEELQAIRLRVHGAREAIVMAFVTHCHNHGRDLFPTVESLGGIRDRLAHSFLLPEPFCGTLKTDDNLTSGLLLCNSANVTLKELYNRLHAMGSRWVRGVRQEAATPESRSSITTLDVLEECQRVMLAKLDKGIFDPIINDDSLFTTNDRAISIQGRCTIQTWLTIVLGGEGIMIALGGKMSAGKSSILNAMLGRPLLPTAFRVCTAVPCRLYHVPDQMEPTLNIPWMKPYEEALEWIKAEGLSKRYRDSDVPEQCGKWAKFEKIDPDGRDMLLKIEANEYPRLIQETSGPAVARQMDFLNHLIRICRAFGNEVDMGDPHQWPVLSVEFTGLKHYRQDLSAPFSLLDLPGYNDNAAEDTERFTQLMNRAARQADVVVPVIAGTAIVETQTWSKHIIRPEWSSKITSVIITRLDLIKQTNRLRLPTVAQMCMIPNRYDCISLCDAPQGMAAMQLHLRLDEIDLKYANDAILPDATAKTEPRLREEIKGIIEELSNQAGSLHRLHQKHLDPKAYEDFSMEKWRDLVKNALLESQLRQTCDKFAENTIEGARRWRVSQFIVEIEPILEDLLLSLDGGLALNRASLSKLYDTQRETERVLSDFRYVITRWDPAIDQVRTQQEEKLRETLKKFEHIARKNAEEAISRRLQSLTPDGHALVLSKVNDQEALLVRYRRAVLDSLNKDVENVMGDLIQLWDENKNTVLSLLVGLKGIAKHPHLEAVITITIKRFDNVRRLDPGKIRIAVSGTPGTWARWMSKLNGSKSDPVAIGAAKQTKARPRWQPKFGLSIQTQSSNSNHSTNIFAPKGPPPPSGSSGEHPDGTFPSLPLSSPLDPEDLDKLGAAMRPASIAKASEIGISQLCDSITKVDPEVNSNLISKGRGEREKGTRKLTPEEEFYERVLSTTFQPAISRVRASAELCMTESLNEMAALAHRAAVGALEEYSDAIEKQIEAQKSEDTRQLQAEMLERLTRWGNLVVALGAIHEMKRLVDEPVIRAMPSRPPSTLIHSPHSSFAGPPSSRSSSPSLSNRSLLSPI